MRDRGRGYAHRVDIAADAELVWRALTEPEHLARWCSPGAQIRAQKGGLFRASVDRVTELEAHIDIFEPARRMRLIYLPSQSLPATDNPIVDDFILTLKDRWTQPGRNDSQSAEPRRPRNGRMESAVSTTQTRLAASHDPPESVHRETAQEQYPMTGFILRACITALGLWLATRLVSGIRIDDPSTIVLAGVLLGIVNAIVQARSQSFSRCP